MQSPRLPYHPSNPTEAQSPLKPGRRHLTEKVGGRFTKAQYLAPLAGERQIVRFAKASRGPGAMIERRLQLAAEVAARNNSEAFVVERDSDDLAGAIVHISRVYESWYVEQGFNFEFGLTGSKLQAVACAACTATLKISQAWYVRPAEYDPNRFTTGVGDTSVFAFTLDND